MTRASKYTIPAALAVMMFVGCGKSGNGPEVNGSDCPDFTASIGGLQSRAYDRTWESGDEIGISGAGRTNVCHVTTDGSGSFEVKSAGEQIYFLNDGETRFTAYYPWTELAAGTVALNADTREQAGQKEFDFLWAEAYGKKDAPDVAFNFSHMMAKLTFTVKPGEAMSYEEAKAARLSLKGCGHTGSFDTASGNATATAGNTDETWYFSEFAGLNDTERSLTFSFVVFPQVLAKPLDFMAEIEQSDGKTLSLRASIDFTDANSGKDGDNARNEWVAGRQYKLSLTLNKTELNVTPCTITDWKTNESSGGASPIVVPES